MVVVSPGQTTSGVFKIAPGKQITLYAAGLSGADKVVLEILELSEGTSDFTGNYCCPAGALKTEIIRRTPLLCPDGRQAVLTADFPFGTLDAPQNVPIGVRVIADSLALVTVSVEESDSSGCMSCICDRPPEECEDTSWAQTGEFRCNGERLEVEEVSNCKNTRWTDIGPVVWTDTGDVRCVGSNVEKEQANDCGKTKWVVDGPITWTDTGAVRCVGGNVEKEQANDCGKTKWIVDGPVTWTDTGDVRCVGGNVEKEQTNDCGQTKWIIQGPVTWVDTGDVRCVGEVVQKKQTDNCCCNAQWVDVGPVTWTDTGVVRCAGGNVEKEQANDCGKTKWVAVGPVTWVRTGKTQCMNNLIEYQETNDCGSLRWTPGTEVCGYCASMPLDCGGFAYTEGDNKDPAATVQLPLCGDTPSTQIGFVYPTPRLNATVEVFGCPVDCVKGPLLGYAANRSTCAPVEVVYENCNDCSTCN
jgi:hypothetical protein